MLIAEHEILFPLNTRRRSRMAIVSFCLLFSLGVYAWLLVQSARLGFDLFSWFVLVLGALFILIGGWLFILDIRKLRVPAPIFRVTTEGIFVSVFIPWSEITAIFPYTPPGAGLVVGIVVRDFDALLARYAQEHASGVFMRGFLRVNAWLFPRFPGYQAQVNIPQSTLPLSIHELMAEIRTRFAPELHEHQITIREWQY